MRVIGNLLVKHGMTYTSHLTKTSCMGMPKRCVLYIIASPLIEYICVLRKQLVMNRYNLRNQWTKKRRTINIFPLFLSPKNKTKQTIFSTETINQCLQSIHFKIHRHFIVQKYFLCSFCSKIKGMFLFVCLFVFEPIKVLSAHIHYLKR